MSRLVFFSVLMSAALISASAIAQTTPSINYNSIRTPEISYNSIRTPEIQLGSGSAPTAATVRPLQGLPSAPSDSLGSDAPPASTELLATRHFDFLVSPTAEFPSPHGNMADTSISLGEYARQLRAQKQSVAR